MIWAPFKSLTRIFAFVTKELSETVRRPGVLASLLLGPFAIMAIFGFGFNGIRRPLDTVIVIPPDSGLRRDVGYYRDLAGPSIHLVRIDATPQRAERELHQQLIDMVVEAPADASQKLKAGKQAVIMVKFNIEDPVQSNYVSEIVGTRLQADVNRQITQTAVRDAEQNAPGTQSRVPPATVADPTQVDTQNIAPSPPDVVFFFGPAVFALVLQHLAVTLTALSFVREKLSGALEVFRVSPVGAFEILVGKYVAYTLLNGLVAAVVLASLVGIFHVPFLGSPAAFAGVVVLLTLASLGFGLLISVVSNSERQAVQLSLLLLLASVFFSGFVLPVDQFIPAVRGLAYALPVTHGIRLTQDLMLRGTTVAQWEAGVLAIIAAVCFLLTLILARRSLASH